MGHETAEIMRGGSYVWTLSCERKGTKGAMSRGHTELRAVIFYVCLLL